VRGINDAIQAAGGAAALAKELGISHQSVYHWAKRGWVPAQRAVDIEERYGVPRESLVNERIARVLAAPASGLV
jgi:DNA-binding transcriptional regulator YdaS (Cro superfamily)